MGLFSSLKNIFTGRKGKFEQQNLLGPEQQGAYQNLLNAANGQGAGGAFGQAADYYRDLLDPNSQTAQQMSAPALQQFQQDILPGIAEQYAGGGSGALSSSGFRNSAIRAGADLSERLAAMRAGLRQQGAAGLVGVGQQAVSPSYNQNIYRPRTPGILDQAAQGFGGAVANIPNMFAFGKGQSAPQQPQPPMPPR